MNIKSIFTALIAFCCLLSLRAQDNTDDWGGQVSVEISKKIIKKLTLSFEEEFRLHKNFSRADRFSHSLDLTYKPFKFLKGGVSYNLLNYYDLQDGWDYRHRYNIHLTGDKSFGRFNVALRERLQGTYRPQALIDHNPKWYLRSRVKVEYDIRKSHFEPFASAEMYYSLNDPDPANRSINRWRFIAGSKYNINKKNNLQLYYRYTNYADQDDNNGHMICIGYSVDI